MLYNDLYKRVQSIIADTDFDIALLDALVERHAVFSLGGYYRYTAQRSLIKSKLLSTLQYEKLDFDDAKKIRLACSGLSSLLQRIKQHKPEAKIVFNELYWSRLTIEGDLSTANGRIVSDTMIKRQNTVLTTIYNHLRTEHPEVTLLQYTPEELLADKLHRLGDEPFHYGLNFFRSFALKMHALSTALPENGTPEVSALIA